MVSSHRADVTRCLHKHHHLRLVVLSTSWQNPEGSSVCGFVTRAHSEMSLTGALDEHVSLVVLDFLVLIFYVVDIALEVHSR